MNSRTEELRFFQDAEFTQALGNIDYVLWLAKQGYFDDSSFLNYLSYLGYMSQPEYAIHMCFPRGLEVLALLQSEQIRDLLKEDPMSFRRIVTDQSWSSWARKSETSLV
jgi:mediator of RNA polymerase II transcription subunit 31